jgi:hypothetical protein
MIPKNIFFIFGLREDFCKKPFAFFHYLNILSAKIINPSYNITVYYKYKPSSLYFEKLKAFCKLVSLDNDYSDLLNKKYKFAEHVAGRIRLQLLKDFGGIYLDSDVVCCKKFDDLLNNSYVMGKELGPIKGGEHNKHLIGLCDAVILSEKESEFVKKYISGYELDYREHWNYNAVEMPFILSLEVPNLITTLNSDYFFKFQWDEEGTTQLFEEFHDFSNCYCIHQWEGFNYDRLKKYNKDYILNKYDTLSCLYKNVLNACYNSPFKFAIE